MGGNTPKQFLEIGGKAILHRTIERFVEACPGVKVMTVLPEDGIETWKDYCITRGFSYPQTIVTGGITRFHSVQNAMEKIPDGAIVAVHDGVRPLVSVKLIRSMLAKMSEVRALIPVTPSVDTLKAARTVTKADGSTEIVPIEGRRVDRSEVFGAQTPQMFLSEDIKAAYRQPFDTAYTDDASVAEANKIPLAYCQGERFNIKITTPEDLIIAGAVMKM